MVTIRSPGSDVQAKVDLTIGKQDQDIAGLAAKMEGIHGTRITRLARLAVLTQIRLGFEGFLISNFGISGFNGTCLCRQAGTDNADGEPACIDADQAEN